ncbi:hypothetical protein GTZ89_13240 [Streptomyces sp. SID8382]|uniref:hypothetical protein n=1 Tax=Streptomyces malaysiensis TaxID=92644 RepID=UPI000C2CDC9A|nr:MULTISPECIES: hypothetical protein [unclassified Streptomyces]AUA10064.1 hypothetical protein CFP59_02161 [Streptomyces sp. M56]MYX56636.1 hypothetical protein [Streptomyces sp. SID8382]
MSDKTKRAIRTAIQTLLAIAAVLPALAAVIADNDALAVAAPWLVAAVGSAAAAAGIVAHIMATPAVEQLLDRLGIGLPDTGGGTE